MYFDSKFIPKPLRTFGGKALIGRRKSTRPLSSKHPINLTIKAKVPVFSRRLKAQHNSNFNQRTDYGPWLSLRTTCDRRRGQGRGRRGCRRPHQWRNP